MSKTCLLLIQFDILCRRRLLKDRDSHREDHPMDGKDTINYPRFCIFQNLLFFFGFRQQTPRILPSNYDTVIQQVINDSVLNFSTASFKSFCIIHMLAANWIQKCPSTSEVTCHGLKTCKTIGSTIS